MQAVVRQWVTIPGSHIPGPVPSNLMVARCQPCALAHVCQQRGPDMCLTPCRVRSMCIPGSQQHLTCTSLQSGMAAQRCEHVSSPKPWLTRAHRHVDIDLLRACSRFRRPVYTWMLCTGSWGCVTLEDSGFQNAISEDGVCTASCPPACLVPELGQVALRPSISVVTPYQRRSICMCRVVGAMCLQ